MADRSGFDPSHPSPGPELSDMVQVFAVFAEPARLRLLEFLSTADRRLPECVAALGMEASLVSVHLRNLVECGLVSAPAGGRHGHYRICEPRVHVLLALARSLTEDNAHALRSCPYIPGTNQ